MSLTLDCFFSLKDNITSVIFNSNSNEAYCIDVACSNTLITYLQKNNLTLKAIIITHHHGDHTNNLEHLHKLYHCSVFVPNQEKTLIPFYTHTVSPNQTLTFDHFSLKAIHTPGHTHGHLSYLSYELNALFCGDALFHLGCGRLFEGTAEDLTQTLATLSQLNNTLMLYYGHDYSISNANFTQTLIPQDTAFNLHHKKLQHHAQMHYPFLTTLED